MDEVLKAIRSRLCARIQSSGLEVLMAMPMTAEVLGLGQSAPAKAGKTAKLLVKSATGETEVVQPAKRRYSPRRCKKVNHEVTERERMTIMRVLGNLEPHSSAYDAKRDKLCLRFKLTRKQVSGVIVAPKMLAGRRAKENKAPVS